MEKFKPTPEEGRRGEHDDTGDDNTSLGPRDVLKKEGILPPDGKDLGRGAYKNRDYVAIEDIPAPERDFENQGAEDGDYILVDPKYAEPRKEGEITTWKKKLSPKELERLAAIAKKQENTTIFGRNKRPIIENSPDTSEAA